MQLPIRWIPASFSELMYTVTPGPFVAFQLVHCEIETTFSGLSIAVAYTSAQTEKPRANVEITVASKGGFEMSRRITDLQCVGMTPVLIVQ